MKKKLLLILICAALLLTGCKQGEVVYKNTTLNGRQLSGMTYAQATAAIVDIAKQQQQNINIDLCYDGQTYTINGSQFDPDYNKIAQDVLQKSKPTFAQRINVFDSKKNNLVLQNVDLVNSLDEQIDQIALQIDKQPKSGEIIFDKDSDSFCFGASSDGVSVDKIALKQQILQALQTDSNVNIQVPVTKIAAENQEDLAKNIQKRSEFSTNYSSSVDGRKHNVKLALSAFNGMRIESGQEVSFNDVIEQNIDDNEFQTAKIILNGEFVNGRGGGVCQASTTLYNALLLADIQILEVHPHSLPVSYVPLAFDAMVNRGTSDLRFKNTLENPIFIKTWGDDTDAYVEIWGEPFADGYEVKTRADFVGTLPHPGDKIIPDTDGKYSDKITFKGEYYRVKSPQEGYESKAILIHTQDGEVIDEKEIRHEFYAAQYGIIYEGTEDVIEGIELPENTVKFIPPQKQESSISDNVQNKIQNDNPSQYNP